MARKKTRQIVLLKTVVYQGVHYFPDDVVEWDNEIVDELIEKEAAEPCVNVKPDVDA
ncbi:MAG: hypothetical protein JEZ12_24855 [Desulfobacterium sp.]|nr:hypothetical protein [Desulfobacterium sp.]